jgi:hypothetical protein
MIRQSARIFEGLALAIMATGIGMVWQPWSHGLFRWGFLVTVAGIVSFMVAAHLPDREEPS